MQHAIGPRLTNYYLLGRKILEPGEKERVLRCVRGGEKTQWIRSLEPAPCAKEVEGESGNRVRAQLENI